MEVAVVSIGYQGRSAEEIPGLLQNHGVSILVGVRMNPISRKAGISKTALAEALAVAGIEYRHERSLGNPKDNRDPFRQGLPSARARYDALLDGQALEAFEEFVILALAAKVSVLCYERDHSDCHRSCILNKAQKELT